MIIALKQKIDGYTFKDKLDIVKLDDNSLKTEIGIIYLKN